MTTERLEEIEARESKATPGPWDAESDGGNSAESANIAITDPSSKRICDTLNADGQLISCDVDEDGHYYYEDGQRRLDMEFLAHARTDVPELIQALKEAQGQLASFQSMGDVVCKLRLTAAHAAIREYLWCPDEEELAKLEAFAHSAGLDKPEVQE